MKGATLFSGIGAPEAAMPQIDWRWCAEIDPFAAAVHAAHFPGVPNLGDVTKIDPAAVEPVDLIVFGSPCTSFSVAGKRLGLDDPRGNLALVALRLVAAIRPRWFLFENVPGLLSSDGGRDFGTFLGAVEQCGYGWSYRTLDAQYFGVPQRRRRVFVVGCLGDWRPAAAVLFEPASLHGDPAPGREARQATTGSLAASLGGGDENDAADNRLIPATRAYGGNRTAGPTAVASACNAHGGPHGRMDFGARCKDLRKQLSPTVTNNADNTDNTTERVALWSPNRHHTPGRNPMASTPTATPVPATPGNGGTTTAVAADPTDPTDPTVTDPTVDSSAGSTTAATDTTAAAAAAAATAAATPTPSSPTNTAAAAAASVVASLQDIIGDQDADDDERTRACEVLIEALTNDSFVSLLQNADSQAAAASSSSDQPSSDTQPSS